MSADERLAAEGLVRMSKGMCDDLASDPELEKVLTAELTAMLGASGGRRKRMRGGIRVGETVKALMAALCATGSMVFNEITGYPLLKIKGLTDRLNNLNTPAGKADKDALISKVKTLLKASVGGIAVADLSSPSSRLVKLAVVIIRALNEVYPNAFYSLERLPTLAVNLMTIGVEAAPIIKGGIVTAAATWALRIVYRRLAKPAGEKAARAAITARDFLLSDESADAVVDAVIDQIPRLAEMALQAGSGAVRAAGTVWAGRLRNASGKFVDKSRSEAAAIAGAVAALGVPAGAEAAMASSGEAEADAVAEASQIVASSTGSGRRRKTRKLIRQSKKRTLRRKY